ncbi:hypothetical protein E1B28_004883 [Marasmius oreades]|uniref:XRRM domain-containing protein n=1 Tax=Marasmius oreades TaxID=181124 RepID=A0A9P8ADF4_9AGAR|nr:uncharacterized protein E1B28_004883 [Marasmius oreades]KAG7097544.1 hypothetical protein E1B28_004883 [Marasmius oreades]
MSLNFIPRKVGKPKTIPPHTAVASPNGSQPRVNDEFKGKGKATLQTEPESSKAQPSDEDLCTVISLAMSDYAIWLNSDVRRRLSESVSDGNEGFISLSFLLNHTPSLRGLLSSSISETVIVKALRGRQSHLDVRMMFTKPEWHNWDKAKDQKDAGMYEIRRKDWEGLISRMAAYTRVYWDKRTLYLECLPVHCKSVGSIGRFVDILLTCSLNSEPSSTSPTDPLVFSPKIQAVTLPPHHLAKSGEEHKCKGFAFVIFTAIEHVEMFLERWPWDRNRYDSSPGHTGNLDLKEAFRFGFRCLSKGGWDALKEEYLSYRTKLVQELVEFNDERRQEATSGRGRLDSENDPYQQEALISEEQAGLTSCLSLSSPYPPSCLIFVRSIHPETNKTTLKSLFTKSFPTTPQSGKQTIGLDYVDYSKGLDSCYLRVTTPGHATAIIDYFTLNKVAQGSGLDACGSPLPLKPAPHSSAIMVELVLGRREQIYWEKVPLKVRTAAVYKCIKEMGDLSLQANQSGIGTIGREDDFDDATRRKKRRK